MQIRINAEKGCLNRKNIQKYLAVSTESLTFAVRITTKNNNESTFLNIVVAQLKILISRESLYLCREVNKNTKGSAVLTTGPFKVQVDGKANNEVKLHSKTNKN